jgi:hypothetical protein
MVEDLLLERGIDVCQVWWNQFDPMFRGRDQKSKRRWRWHVPKWTSGGRARRTTTLMLPPGSEDRIEDLAGRAPAAPGYLGESAILH